jgi:methionyl-tRNA formyltransferase
VPALRAFASRVSCVLVVTQPDRPAGRGKKLQPTPVKSAAGELGIATLEPERLRDALTALADARADLFAVASYGKIVPQTVLDLPALGALNVHPSLLPLYRGATPLQTQLRDGVSESGVTIIAMDAGMDTGAVVIAERSRIGPRETYGELHDRFARIGADLLARACDDVVAGRASRLPQALFGSQERAARTITRPLAKADLDIDWSASARAVVDRIRTISRDATSVRSSSRRPERSSRENSSRREAASSFSSGSCRPAETRSRATSSREHGHRSVRR